MAAYAALVSLMTDLDDIQNHLRHSFSFDNKQITSLSQTVDFLIDFLESHNSHECSTGALESRIASAAHAAHDVIQSHVLNQIHAGSTLRRKAGSYFLRDLQKAINNMEFVQRKTMRFKAKWGLLKAEKPVYSAPASISGKNIMVGFDAVKDQLLDRLTGNPSGPRQVIPLVGMGGIGKTTLAKNVYDHLHIHDHFEVRLWATISQQYSVETIFTQLFGESKSTTDGNVSGEVLHKELWGRRYLIVLDDMWNIEAWEEIERFMPDNGNGSCVIVTTRLSNLTVHLSSSPFKMNFLDEDKSWELFCGEAFGQEERLPEIEKIGKRIVKRCRGLPLSIIVMGGHLRKYPGAIEYWEKVASLMNPISSSVDDDQCLKIISLSYHHLPAFLKPCFLYMGIYREDAWVDVSNLFNFWIAEGFLKQKESLSLEEVAQEYLNDLIERNLVLVRKRRWNGKVEKCGIHDSVRELCLKVGKKEKFMCGLEAIGRKRRNSVRRPNKKEFVALRRSSIRSRVAYAKWKHQRIDFQYNMSESGFVNAHWLGGLLNLRHLDYSLGWADCSIFGILLSSISLFWNVKTLIFRDIADDDIIIVPYEIWEMPQLRHLEFGGAGVHLRDPLPNQEECTVLQNLHTLLGVRDLSLSEEVCKRIPNIKRLAVSYRVESHSHLKAIFLHNLGRFNKLEVLEYRFMANYDDFKWRDFVLSITIPSSLKKLSLRCPNLPWKNLTMIKSLLHLEDLELYMMKGPEWNLVDEEFRSLKFLQIFTADDLSAINANSSNFPVLEKLHIKGAPKLNKIPIDIGEIPTLQLIKFTECKASAAISAMRIVEEQESSGNQDIQLDIRHLRYKEKKRFQKWRRSRI